MLNFWPFFVTHSQKVATKNDLPLPSENASGRYNNSFNINYLIPHQIAGRLVPVGDILKDDYFKHLVKAVGYSFSILLCNLVVSEIGGNSSK